MSLFAARPDGQDKEKESDATAHRSNLPSFGFTERERDVQILEIMFGSTG